MSEIALGDPGCSISDVVTTMSQQEDFCLIEQNYDQLLIKLNITSAKSAIPIVKLQLKSRGPVEGTLILLARWVEKEKRNCALHKFLSVLIDIGMSKTAMALRVKFLKIEVEKVNTNERNLSRTNQPTIKEITATNIKSESILYTNQRENTADYSISNATNGSCSRNRRSTTNAKKPTSDWHICPQEDLESSPLRPKTAIFPLVRDTYESSSKNRHRFTRLLESCTFHKYTANNKSKNKVDDFSNGDDEHQFVNSATAMSRNWKVVYLANCMQSIICVTLYLTIFFTINGIYQEIFSLPKEVKSLRDEIISMKYKISRTENCDKCTSFTKRTQLVEITASSYLEYQHSVYDEDNSNFDVFIYLNNTNGWIPGIPMHKSDRIKKLHTEGNLNPELMHSILKEAKNIGSLHITNSNESMCGNNTGKKSYKKIELQNLIELHLENFASCDFFYELLVTKITTGNLRNFNFDGGQLNEKSVNYIHKLLSNNMDSLQKIYLPSVIWNFTNFGNSDSILDSVTEIHADFLPEKNSRGAFIGKNICTMFPNLITFVSADGHLPLGELKYLFKCKMLISLTVKVVVPENIRSVDVMRILEQMPNLKYGHITFWFVNKPCTLLGEDKAIKNYKFTLETNCYDDE